MAIMSRPQHEMDDLGGEKGAGTMMMEQTHPHQHQHHKQEDAEEAASGGCCGWFSIRFSSKQRQRRRKEKQYAATHGHDTVTRGDGGSQQRRTASTAAGHATATVDACIAACADMGDGVSNNSTLCRLWLEALRSLKLSTLEQGHENHAVNTSIRSQALVTWIEQQGFQPLLELLQATASAAATRRHTTHRRSEDDDDADDDGGDGYEGGDVDTEYDGGVTEGERDDHDDDDGDVAETTRPRRTRRRAATLSSSLSLLRGGSVALDAETSRVGRPSGAAGGGWTTAEGSPVLRPYSHSNVDLLSNRIPPSPLGIQPAPSPFSHIAGSPSATLRWTRRQSMRSARDFHQFDDPAPSPSQLHIPALQLPPQHQPTSYRRHPIHLLAHEDQNEEHVADMIDRPPSVQPASSGSRLADGESDDLAAAAALTQHDTDASSARMHAAQRTMSPLPSLPLDLSVAQEINRRQQELDEERGRTMMTMMSANGATTHHSSPSAPHTGVPQIVQFNPSAFHGLHELGYAIGERLAIMHAADMANDDDGEHAQPATSSANLSKHDAKPSPDIDDEDDDPTTMLCCFMSLSMRRVVTPADVAVWVYSLVLLLKQVMESLTAEDSSAHTGSKSHHLQLKKGSHALFAHCFPTLPPTTMASLLDASSVSSAGHSVLTDLAALFELTAPIIHIYASDRSRLGEWRNAPALLPPRYGTDDAKPPSNLALLPPKEWMASQCTSHTTRVMLQIEKDQVIPFSTEQQLCDAIKSAEDEFQLLGTQLAPPQSTTTLQALATSRSRFSIELGSADLKRMCVLLQWLEQQHQIENIKHANDKDSTTSRTSSSSPISDLVIRCFPFLLHCLLEVFCTHLIHLASTAADIDEISQVVAVWNAWYENMTLVFNMVARVCKRTHASLNDLDRPPHLHQLYTTLRKPSIYKLSTTNALSAGVSFVAFPSLTQLLTHAAALLFDPQAHPLELGAIDDGDVDIDMDMDGEMHGTAADEMDGMGPSGVGNMLLPHTQLAVIRAIQAVGELVCDRRCFNLHASDGDADDGLDELSNHVASSSSTSPFSSVGWFWMSLLPLFVPTTGGVYQFLQTASDALDYVEDVAVCSVEERFTTAPAVMRALEMQLCSFIANLVFSTPNANRPLPCPWLMDDAFTAAYLHLHYNILQTHYHAVKNKHSSVLAIAHARILNAAAQIPTSIMLPQLIHVAIDGRQVSHDSGSTPQHVRLTHIHHQLYHLGLAAWLTRQISLELELVEEEDEMKTNNAADDGDHGGMAEQTTMDAGANADGQREFHGDAVGSVRSAEVDQDAENDDAAHSISRSDTSESSSDFSNISFSDSYVDDDAMAPPPPPALPAPSILPKLTIQHGKRHINEQFALGMDGRPLHPEAEEDWAIQQQHMEQNQQVEDKDDGGHEHSLSAAASESTSLSDLGDDGWGDSTDSLQPTPREPAGSTGGLTLRLNFPGAGAGKETAVSGVDPAQSDNVEQNGNENVITASSALTPSTSYHATRRHHPLYRSRSLHVALVDLLISLCLDPSAPAGRTLNPLYCTRFPLQLSSEQQKMGMGEMDMNHPLSSATSTASHSMSDQMSSSESGSFDEIGRVSEGDEVESLQPLGVNVPFTLHRHVNHSSNHFLCSRLLEAGALTLGASPSASSSSSWQTGRRRLLKLLFEQLFEPHCYVNRNQIGRGRFACVYAADYVSERQENNAHCPLRVALKQVELPATIHDQMSIVDLFTEISILECLASHGDDDGSCMTSHPTTMHSAGAIDMYDFGVGEGCYWMVMPLAQCSLKTFKLRMAEMEEEEREELRKNEKTISPRRLVHLTHEDALIESLLSSALDSTAVATTRPRHSSFSIPARRLLVSLSLFRQALRACMHMQRQQIVHFDIKADNFLVVDDCTMMHGKQHEASNPSTHQHSSPLRVCLADFGEAMFLSSPSSLSSSSFAMSHASSSSNTGMIGGSIISRGTENIQSPEMLTLMRALDRTFDAHDRRRKQEADCASDVWAMGCLFYEICMHAYGRAVDDDDEANHGEIGGNGLLFEESMGLPIFLQVTSTSLPILSDARHDLLSRPPYLGPFLPVCLSFLHFVLKRDRLQRPTLIQVATKLDDTVRDIVDIACKHTKTVNKTKEDTDVPLRSVHTSTSGDQLTPSTAAVATSKTSVPPSPAKASCSSCGSLSSSSWFGSPPTFRCSACSTPSAVSNVDGGPGASVMDIQTLRSMVTDTDANLHPSPNRGGMWHGNAGTVWKHNILTLRIHQHAATRITTNLDVWTARHILPTDTSRLISEFSSMHQHNESNQSAPCMDSLLLLFETNSHADNQTPPLPIPSSSPSLFDSHASIFFLPLRAVSSLDEVKLECEMYVAVDVGAPESKSNVSGYAIPIDLMNAAAHFVQTHRTMRVITAAPLQSILIHLCTHMYMERDNDGKNICTSACMIEHDTALRQVRRV